MSALPWGLGLGVFLCVPFVSSVLASIAMVVAGRLQRGKERHVAENGRNAANWGLTYLLLTVVLVGTHFGLLYALTRDGGSIDGFFPFGIIILTWITVSVVHVGFSIAGLVKGLRQEIFSAPAISFFSRPEVDDERR
ncbi:hypothetical protein GCM10009821_13730 [Aeromicrobium halocynthiae]|uniref:DUF4870 domain-containing protein n=1 Tax=Aeromicrobium halocynthiae TaxID=560557 RepID=A0ABN2VXQ4_9ACTN